MPLVLPHCDKKILDPGQTIENISEIEAKELLERNFIEYKKENYVVYGDNLDVVKLFLKAGMEVDVIADLGMGGSSYINSYTRQDRLLGTATALMIAAERNAEDTIRYLLDHGADPLIKSHWGGLDILGEETRTALHSVLRYKGRLRSMKVAKDNELRIFIMLLQAVTNKQAKQNHTTLNADDVISETWRDKLLSQYQGALEKRKEWHLYQARSWKRTRILLGIALFLFILSLSFLGLDTIGVKLPPEIIMIVKFLYS